MTLKSDGIKLTIMLLFVGAVVYGATKGDQQPFTKYGKSQVAGYDAGTGAPVCIGVSNQNSVMVRNFNRDGGTGATLYAGFDTSVSPDNGMPIQHSETITVDVVALSQGFPPGPADGGVQAVSNKLCFIGAPGAVITDICWMVVK